jgi:hypothetical protein
MNAIALDDDSRRLDDHSATPTAGRADWSRSALHWAAAAWVAVALAGQLVFAGYVVLYYGRSALAGRPQDWNHNLAVGYVPGDAVGNAMLAAHLAAAVLVMLAGALQLLPWVRRRWPAWHRWSGRTFMVAACLGAAGGLYMTATRPVIGDASQHIAVSVNGLLVLLCAALAWYHAAARRIDIHRRWALRLYLLVNGVWFFRIGLMLWLLVNHGPVGFDPKTFTGPFITILSCAQFLLPLAVLELYLRAQASGSAAARAAVAAGLGLATLATAAGSVGAFLGMWLPRL